jgi:hypothetical protein
VPGSAASDQPEGPVGLPSLPEGIRTGQDTVAPATARKERALNAALIAAAAAVAGGLLTAYATRSVEAMRVRAALVEKAEERRLASIERFLLAVNAWLDWLMYIEEQPSQDHYPELNRRVKERDDAYRELILLSSDRLHHWLVTVYAPLEYELKRTYAHDVRYLNTVTEEARNVRIKFSRVLREDLIDQLRPEVEALRNPVKHARGIRIS